MIYLQLVIRIHHASEATTTREKDRRKTSNQSITLPDFRRMKSMGWSMASTLFDEAMGHFEKGVATLTSRV
jgi:hypothetical protein